VVGWLYEGTDSRIPSTARELLSAGEISVSPIVELELTYLYEVGRVTEPAAAPLTALRRSIGLTVADISMATLVEAATPLSWTRHPFNRLIAAHAVVADTPLLTANPTILQHLPQAVWS
jgi:PIN domain nuclease of toxin-antitoxin system